MSSISSCEVYGIRQVGIAYLAARSPPCVPLAVAERRCDPLVHRPAHAGRERSAKVNGVGARCVGGTSEARARERHIAR